MFLLGSEVFSCQLNSVTFMVITLRWTSSGSSLGPHRLTGDIKRNVGHDRQMAPTRTTAARHCRNNTNKTSRTNTATATAGSASVANEGKVQILGSTRPP